MPKAFASPGPRSIYPEICDSRSLSRCGLLANALWPRLIVQADDQGRLHGDAADIRGECFPKMPRITAKAVENALAELASVESIFRYSVDGEPYIQLRDWWDYQGHQRRAYPSRHPAPDGWPDYIYGIDGHPTTLAAARGETPQPADKRGAAPPSPSRPVPSNPTPSRPVEPRGAATTGLRPLKELIGAREDLLGSHKASA